MTVETDNVIMNVKNGEEENRGSEIDDDLAKYNEFINVDEEYSGAAEDDRVALTTTRIASTFPPELRQPNNDNEHSMAVSLVHSLFLLDDYMST